MQHHYQAKGNIKIRWQQYLKDRNWIILTSSTTRNKTNSLTSSLSISPSSSNKDFGNVPSTHNESRRWKRSLIFDLRLSISEVARCSSFSGLSFSRLQNHKNIQMPELKVYAPEEENKKWNKMKNRTRPQSKTLDCILVLNKSRTFRIKYFYSSISWINSTKEIKVS